MKTMLRLAETRDEISVVSDQIGTPTYAGDLADVILKIISSKNTNFGLYHYSNEGQTSWYGFAKAIFEGSNLKIKTTPIKTEAYPTPAKRPVYSVMDKTKITSSLKIEIPLWDGQIKSIINI
jgi:dTDP-4-dehydrorhamnose reductase